MMKRGDVWWINFDLSFGGEIKKIRPAIIVSNNASNKYLNRVQVIPLTSNINRLYPSEAYIEINDKKCKAMADQLTTVSKKRLTKYEGSVSLSDMRKIERAIEIQLGF